MTAAARMICRKSDELLTPDSTFCNCPMGECLMPKNAIPLAQEPALTGGSPFHKPEPAIELHYEVQADPRKRGTFFTRLSVHGLDDYADAARVKEELLAFLRDRYPLWQERDFSRVPISQRRGGLVLKMPGMPAQELGKR